MNTLEGFNALENKLKEMAREMGELHAEIQKNEPEFKTGDWLHLGSTGLIGRVDMRVDMTDEHGHYIKFAEGDDDYITKDYKHARKLTHSEIKSGLIKEAKRRGLLDQGTKVECLDNLHNPKWIYDCEIFFYDEYSDTLHTYGRVIYRQGKWAKVVENTPVKFFDWDVEYLSTDVKLGCEGFSKFYLKNTLENLQPLRDKTVQEVIDELKKLDL